MLPWPSESLDMNLIEHSKINWLQQDRNDEQSLATTLEH